MLRWGVVMVLGATTLVGCNRDRGGGGSGGRLHGTWVGTTGGGPVTLRFSPGNAFTVWDEADVSEGT